MIGKLQGIIDYIGDDYIILMANGVGYKVFVPDVSRITHHASRVTDLWIETIVREDSIRLFGFESLATQDLFNKLTSVSGVGPKVAMAILGTLRAETLLTAIATGDAKTISTAPGVGKKVAEKIIVELRGKSALGTGDWAPGTDGNSPKSRGPSPYTDLLSALESLGYRRAEVVDLAGHLVRENPDLDVGALVRLALRGLAK
jgi:Holliday junction DNA helicase RuvA